MRATATEELLARLAALGLTPAARCTLTRNQSTVVSFRGARLRVHEAFVTASDEVLRAIVTFVQGRGSARIVARRTIRNFPIPRDPGRARRRERLHPDDEGSIARLREEHARLNAKWFGGQLGSIDIRISRRMRRKLGHYASGVSSRGAVIAISHRHVQRNGWHEASKTLLHEMVHQWQDETGRRLGHGREFHTKAAEVGCGDGVTRG
jgi:hypothetical protein